MAIVLQNFPIAYFPAPKSACTSVKELLYYIETGRKWDPADWPGRDEVHAYWRWERGFDQDFGPTRAADYDALRDRWTFAVVRDPIKRLLSAYSNRVGHHRDLHRTGARQGLKARLTGLTLDPDIDTFVRRLEAYRAINFSILNHTRPQSYFLGADLSRIDAVYPIEALDALHADLVARTGVDIALPREQTGGRKYRFEDLNRRTRERLLGITAPDYAYLSDYYTPPPIVPGGPPQPVPVAPAGPETAVAPSRAASRESPASRS